MAQRSHSLAGHEGRTWAVATVNLAAMAVLVGGGMALRSAAVLAEGVHMGAHVGAVAIAAVGYRLAAYSLARGGDAAARRIGDAAGLANGLFLALIAVLLALESLGDLQRGAVIDVYAAMGLAAFGLVVNLVSLGFLHAPNRREPGARDLSLRALYLHMLGDAAVGVLSVAGLLLVKLLGWRWADGLAGLCGAMLIAGLAMQIVRSVLTARAARSPVLPCSLCAMERV